MFVCKCKHFPQHKQKISLTLHSVRTKTTSAQTAAHPANNNTSHMNIIEITSLNHPGVELFSTLTEAQLRNRLHEDEGVFIAESPKVISVALDTGHRPLALLCERRHITGDAADIIARIGDTPIYTGTRDTLAALTGYTLTRGVLCAMRRPTLPTVEQICQPPQKNNADTTPKPRRIAVIDSVVDTTNIGAIFRSAAALGIDGILLTPTSCDPLNRRSIRVSMGSVFLLPWTWLHTPIATLRQYGYKTVAMALTDNSVPLSHPTLKTEPRLAIIMGTEGDGLAQNVIRDADYVVRIPMRHNVDSLNVAAASAVAFYELCE